MTPTLGSLAAVDFRAQAVDGFPIEGLTTHALWDVVVGTPNFFSG